jgi:indole-3-glycerol phosphate synthase
MLADGDMLTTYNPASLAAYFEEGGATALSVATDETVLRGGLVHLVHVKRAVAIPVIRHDFIFDAYQLYEARAAGADGVRLIARVLPDGKMRNLLSLTQRLKMTALIDVQTTAELNRVLPLEPRLIGLNNRDWKTGEVNFTITELLRDRIPPHITVVSGGGIQTLEDAKHIAATGIDAILIGKTLLTAEDSPARIRDLLGALNDG